MFEQEGFGSHIGANRKSLQSAALVEVSTSTSGEA